jgi:hypothetical protein
MYIFAPFHLFLFSFTRMQQQKAEKEQQSNLYLSAHDGTVYCLVASILLSKAPGSYFSTLIRNGQGARPEQAFHVSADKTLLESLANWAQIYSTRHLLFPSQYDAEQRLDLLRHFGWHPQRKDLPVDPETEMAWHIREDRRAARIKAAQEHEETLARHRPAILALFDTIRRLLNNMHRDGTISLATLTELCFDAKQVPLDHVVALAFSRDNSRRFPDEKVITGREMTPLVEPSPLDPQGQATMSFHYFQTIYMEDVTKCFHDLLDALGVEHPPDVFDVTRFADAHLKASRVTVSVMCHLVDDDRVTRLRVFQKTPNTIYFMVTFDREMPLDMQ